MQQVGVIPRREVRSGTFGERCLLVLFPPHFGVFLFSFWIYTLHGKHSDWQVAGCIALPLIASHCLNGMRTLGGGGACLVQGWQPRCLAVWPRALPKACQAPAFWWPQTQPLWRLHSAWPVCCLGTARRSPTHHTGDVPQWDAHIGGGGCLLVQGWQP